jgi:hypothetical protein
VRLDEEAEAALQEIRDLTGLPISEALKQGLQSLRQRVGEESRRKPYDLYRELDLGPGGYACAPSTETRRGVATALRKKLRR